MRAAELSGIATQIGDQGWSSMPDFVPHELVEALRRECLDPETRGQFRHAGIGGKRQLRADIRSDEILWLEQPGATLAQRRCLARFEQLRRVLNRVLQVGLFEFECHFARYAPGSFYRRHLDQFAGGGRRRVSVVLYLNNAWQQGDGGELRLYPSPTAGTGLVDLQPVGGNLVAFLSERIPHEVLPARCERLSIAGWFKVRQ